MTNRQAEGIVEDAVTAKDGRSSRRGWLRRLGGYGAGAAAVAALGGSAAPRARASSSNGPTPGEIAVLQFLAAAEQIETDLWQQYTELAERNPAFKAALAEIDPSLIQYINDDRDDELSHANLINAYLASVGATPVNLDPFKTLPSSRAQGADQVGRITNLTSLNVDTSWYNRYRGDGNPDFGDHFPQLVNIIGRPTIPTSNRLGPNDYRAAAHCAAFHFCAIEQGGGSLYCNLLGRVHTPDVVAILASIGPVEVYHFATFHKSLEGLNGLNAGNGLVFPNLRARPGLARLVMPEPCSFLGPHLPACSVIRPRSTANAGALAAATGLINSGLFKGQSHAFLNAVAALAAAADNA
ncbi:MAG: ferritin-like domain-containing protein [Isosphaeraceae bacterium]